MTFEEIAAQMADAVDGIRKAIYGVQVREYIAEGMENVLEVGRQVIASAKAAKSSETNAKSSETAAKTSEGNAKSSETNAKTSETNAKSSETNAASSEAAAKTSEENAKYSADRAAAIVGTDKTLSMDGAAADAKVVGETLRTVTTTVNEKLQAASEDTNTKLDKLKKSISEKGRLVAAGYAWSGGANVALPEETDYVILRFAANTWYNNSSSNGHVERTALCWPEEGFLLARGGVVYLNLTGRVDEQLVSASFKSDGWLYIPTGGTSSLKINWEGYHYI